MPNNQKDPSKIELDQKFWNTLWENKITHWDIGYPSPAITEFMSKFPDKDASILIPGCGNAYEAEFLVKNGFNDITLIDIAPIAVNYIQEKFANYSQIKIFCEDFFEHDKKYDLIIEQTFFCALDPKKRNDYARHSASLLNPNGKIVGLMFEKDFGKPFPPFGGSQEEYIKTFEPYFEINSMEKCENSIPPRVGTELFVHLTKKL
ncbi:MAG TPA: methyltransferase [Chitinophagales bacterium]|nr:methyltransferase [Chitinophagales bacterium]